MGLRNSRIHYRQLEVTHSMENVIYNELRMRGFHVDVGNLTVVEKGKDTKPVKSNWKSILSVIRVLKILYPVSIYAGDRSKNGTGNSPFFENK